jgi:CopG family nickel-responsive transcriptional regulator
MERITMTLDEDLVGALDGFVAERGYANRSEAMRDLLRVGLAQKARKAQASDQCVATLTYVYDHHERELSKRLTHAHHDHHDLSVASLHVHLDHDNCLEVAVLRGTTRSVDAFADRILAERGVRWGHAHVVPTQTDSHGHAHEDGAVPHGHVRPIS